MIDQYTSDALPSESLAVASLDGQPDAELLNAWVRDHQRPALAALIRRYSAMVLTVCRRRCRSEHDAQDAFQTTFLALAGQADRVHHPERLPGWLHTVAHRAANATLERTATVDLQEVDVAYQPVDPLESLTLQHEAMILDEQLSDLPEHYRSVLVLSLYQGMSIDQVARHLEATQGTVRGRLQRGRRMLASRLRRHGFVPVVFFAAVAASRASAVHAMAAAEIASHHLPPTPGNVPQVDAALTAGAEGVIAVVGRPSIKAMGLAAAMSTPLVVGALLIWQSHFAGSPSADQPELSLSAVAENAERRLVVEDVTFAESVTSDSGSNVGTVAAMNEDQADVVGQAGGVQLQSGASPVGGVMEAGSGFSAGPFFGGGAGLNAGAGTPMDFAGPTTVIAKEIEAKLDQPMDLKVHADLDSLAVELQAATGLPVTIDSRSLQLIQQAEVLRDLKLDVKQLPLRSALYQLLSPAGLKAQVTDDGIELLADFEVLSHCGIENERWVTPGIELDEETHEKLEQTGSLLLTEFPLVEAVQDMARQWDVAILVDQRALEEEGLSSETPISCTLKDVTLREALNFITRELQLAYTVNDKVLTVTTGTSVESMLASRIYWLEGTGLPSNDPFGIIQVIETSIATDSWEVMGGPSTISPMGIKRPAILVSTTYQTHHHIKKLLDVMRHGHFGRATVVKPSSVESAPVPAGGGGVF
ncbi:ECF RNA polymerase sigma factor SigE [Stieleria bergensis]|uniref:ECF RNA polymerase sigma factor SigE n=1 Tax=Stieleria bergensis TaxID=2528025 RepID=A0A517SNH0_9BACT|nr:ECF RNA polymerase sigma factor SigE [Planctomycetes bacterium SV_7m_r]